MNFKESAICRRCGREVRRVRCLNGSTYRVDPEPVWIRIAGGGDPFIYIGRNGLGQFKYGYQIGDAWEGEDQTMEVYTPHAGAGRCGR